MRKRSSEVPMLAISIRAVSTFDLARYLSTCGVAKATSNPKIASTTKSSTRVKPASRRQRAAARRRHVSEIDNTGFTSSYRKIINAEHRRQDRADDAGDDRAHDNGERGSDECQQAVRALAQLAFVEVGELEEHLVLAAALLADAHEMDDERGKDARGARRLARDRQRVQ